MKLKKFTLFILALLATSLVSQGFANKNPLGKHDLNCAEELCFTVANNVLKTEGEKQIGNTIQYDVIDTKGGVCYPGPKIDPGKWGSGNFSFSTTDCGGGKIAKLIVKDIDSGATPLEVTFPADTQYGGRLYTININCPKWDDQLPHFCVTMDHDGI